MPQFPRREADLFMLVEEMIGGYTTNPSLFPGANVAALKACRDAFEAAKSDQLEKQAQAKESTETKKKALQALKALTLNQLRQSEVDTAGNPDQLSYISWGPKRPAHPSAPPGQPALLTLIHQGIDTLSLTWKAPKPFEGGPVRTYLIERRIPSGDDKWHPVGIAFEGKAQLTDQPRAQQLEYRVIAVNVGGNSMPSNTVTAVL